MKYRRDIDGLRAVAVVPVVLFHLHFPFIGGGFVGVDVFFVISGFLITGIIHGEMQEGRYSVASFYERRVRRIVPAMLAMLAATLAAGWFLLFPSEFKSLGHQALAILGMVSNIRFYAQAGYFGPDAKELPLLHTWSLAVEEQYYLAFPVLLLSLRRWLPERLPLVLVGLALFSFAAMLCAMARDPSAAFYLLPLRAWELLLGSLLAVGAVSNLPSDRLRSLVTASGLALIAAAMFGYDATTPFPGWAALPPALGAAMVIHGGTGGTSLPSRCLGAEPLVAIGLTSYSLYLWHWPLIVFWKIWTPGDLHASSRVGLLLAAFLLGWASWRIVERPFRQPRMMPRRRLLMLTGGATGILALCFVAVIATGGVASRFAAPVTVLADFAVNSSAQSIAAMREGRCFLNSTFNDVDRFDRQLCLGVDANRPNVLLVGDSFAAHLYPGLAAVYPEWRLLQATASGCPPVIDGAGAARCTGLMQLIFDDFLKGHRVDRIILAGRWQVADLSALRHTLAVLKPYARTLVVVGPLVEYRGSLPRLLARDLADGGNGRLDEARLPGPRATDLAFAAALAESGVRYVSAYEMLCPGGLCTTRIANNGPPIQFDFGHLTTAGSVLISERFRTAGALGAP